MRTDTDVVIIGAGPAGLSAAIELGTRGIRVLVVERNLRTGMAPRAKTTNVRTRTHLRARALPTRSPQKRRSGWISPITWCS